MPPTGRTPNDQLAALLAEAGLSNKGLADRLCRLGQLRGAPSLRYNHSSVARWLAGEHPRQPVPDIIAEVFTVELGRRVSVSDLGMRTHAVRVDAGLLLPTAQAETAQVASLLWRADVEKQRVLVESDFDHAAFPAAALRWLIGPWEPRPDPTPGRRIGSTDVAEIREVTTAFSVLDNRLGGGHVRTPVVEYLHTRVGPLLREGRCNDETRRQLFTAAAVLTKLAAWLYHDLDKQGLAQRYLIQALSMAKHAGDYALSGEILAAMSQQAHYVGQPGTAVDMARTAQTAAKRAGSPVLMTECQVMEAHGYATPPQRDARACAFALTRAEKTYDRATDQEVPDWLGYFDEAYFAAKIAHCFRDLGRAEETERYALRSLNMDPTYRRGKTFNISVLAMAPGLPGAGRRGLRPGKGGRRHGRRAHIGAGLPIHPRRCQSLWAVHRRPSGEQVH